MTSRHGGGACRGRSEAGLPETIVNALTVDVEEYYHGYEFEAALGVDGLRRLPSRVLPQTERLLDLLDTHRARGTFFVLGVVAQRYPRLVREIVERGTRSPATAGITRRCSGSAPRASVPTYGARSTPSSRRPAVSC